MQARQSNWCAERTKPRGNMAAPMHCAKATHRPESLRTPKDSSNPITNAASSPQRLAFGVGVEEKAGNLDSNYKMVQHLRHLFEPWSCTLFTAPA